MKHWVRKTLGLNKQSKMGHSDRNLEDQNTEKNVDIEAQITRFQKRARMLLSVSRLEAVCLRI